MKQRTLNQEGVWMSTTVQKWGNSLGIRIPGHIAGKIGVHQGTEVELIVSDDRKLIIVPQKKKLTLEELLDKCKPENRHDEIDFGREGMEFI